MLCSGHVDLFDTVGQFDVTNQSSGRQICDRPC